jgi:SHS2 domain-containing protein
MRYRFIDHTADIAVEVYGKNEAELIENAGYAFYEAFVAAENLSSDIEKNVEVSADDFEMLLYKWLNELLYLFDTEFFAAREIAVDADEKKASGTLRGGKFTAEMVKVEPKAITMHKFKVDRGDEGLKAFIVIDI